MAWRDTVNFIRHTARRRSTKLCLTGTAAALLISCLPAPQAEPAIDCAPEALGVSRTIELSLDSAPILDRLAAREVVITFDDGPAAGKTREVIDVLAEECVRATFFLQGDNSERHPKVIQDLIGAGHTIGSHGWAHDSLIEMPIGEARTDVTRASEAINAALASFPVTQGMTVKLFRYPYVAANEATDALLRELGLITVTVHADGLDWEERDPEIIVDNVFVNLGKHGDRGIILLHDPFDGSAKVTRTLLARLKENDYRVVAIRPPPAPAPGE